MMPSAPTPSRLSARRSSEGGLTLVEMVLAIAIIAILMASVGSAILIATRGLPDADGPCAWSVDAALVADQFVAELYSAMSIIHCSPTMIEFTVERSGVTHTICYQWSGTPGDPLVRQYDGGAAVDVLAGVQEFALTYHTQTVIEIVHQDIETPEQVLASFVHWSGIGDTRKSYGLAPAERFAEFFTIATLTGDVDQLKVTRVFLLTQFQLTPAGETISVAIHPTVALGDPRPQPDAIGTPDTRSTSYLPSSFKWTEFTFSDVAIDDPVNEYVIVVKGDDADIQLRYLFSMSAPQDNTVALWSSDSGATWEPPPGGARQYNDAPFYVYGTFVTTQSVEVPRNILGSIGIAYRAASDPTVGVDTEVLTVNKPEPPES